MGMLKKDRARLARKQRIRKRIFGTTARPRLSIFRSAQYTYAQIIDDEVKKTIVSCSSAEKELSNKLKSTSSVEAAKTVGQEIANRAKAKKISSVVFDRNGNIFHGRVKAVAEGAREAGLQF
jgi:large subunit ribosomal protein L18